MAVLRIGGEFDLESNSGDPILSLIRDKTDLPEAGLRGLKRKGPIGLDLGPFSGPGSISGPIISKMSSYLKTRHGQNGAD